MSHEKDAFERNNPVGDSKKDPLGERRAAAKQFWTEDGCPESADWSIYWTKADRLFSASKGLRMHLRDHSADSPELRTASVPSSDTPTILSAIQQSSPEGFDEHELICLAQLLHTSTFKLAETSAVGPFSADDVQKLISDLEKNLGSSRVQISTIAESIKQHLLQDTALSNHDRTTIARLSAKIVSASSILAIVPGKKPVAVVETADGSTSEREIK